VLATMNIIFLPRMALSNEEGYECYSLDMQ